MRTDCTYNAESKSGLLFWQGTLKYLWCKKEHLRTEDHTQQHTHAPAVSCTHTHTQTQTHTRRAIFILYPDIYSKSRHISTWCSQLLKVDRAQEKRWDWSFIKVQFKHDRTCELHHLHSKQRNHKHYMWGSPSLFQIVFHCNVFGNCFTCS